MSSAPSSIGPNGPHHGGADRPPLAPFDPTTTAPVGLDPTGVSPPPASVGAESASADVDELVGTTLVKTYAVERVIGEGGMGRVYEARHTRIANKRFAVKVLHPEYLRQPDVVTRFKREAEAAASIGNPHVVGVYDVDRAADGRPFMVTELLDGVELGSQVKSSGPLSVATAVRVVRQVARALGAAHDKGIVHRDVKPANIFLTGSPSAPFAKVLDFGISRIAGKEGTTLTKAGMIMGTPAFMAPEQAKGTAVDHRADIYALGAVLLKALTGRDPFDEQEPQAALVAVLTKEPIWPRAVNPAIPEQLELVIQRAMAKEPEHRYQSMAELHRALAPFDSSAGRDDEPAGPGAQATAPTWSGSGPAAGTTMSLARPELAFLLVLAVVGSLAAVLDAIGAAMRVVRPGSGLSPIEGGLVLLALSFVLATPAWLLVRHVRRNVWGNSAKVHSFSRKLRAPLVTGAATYAVAALTTRLANTFVTQRPAALGWAGWDLLLLGLTATATALAIWAQREGRGKNAPAPGHTPRALVAASITVALGVMGIVGGLVLQPEGSSLQTAIVIEPHQPEAGPKDGSYDESKRSDTSSDTMASTGELEAARAAGVPGLEELRKKYPKDAGVLRALVLEVARSKKTWPRALDLVEELFDLSAEMADDQEMGAFIADAVQGPTELGKRALAIAANKMGKKGPDILYDVWISGTARAKDAEDYLRSNEVRARFTPALAIAVELREAPGCSSKRKLLDRAAALGDQRVIDMLLPLATGSSKGCGFLGMSACPAPCQADAAAMKKTIAAIREGRKK